MPRLTQEEFLTRVRDKSDLTPLETYKGGRRKIRTRCTCGRIFFPFAENIMHGRTKRCTECRASVVNGKNTRKPSEYVIQLKQAMPSVVPLEEYVGCYTKILHRCKTCSLRWMGNPLSLLRGHGCPRCANNLPKTVASVQRKMDEYGRNVTVKACRGARRPATFRCNVCNNSWDARPYPNSVSCPHCNSDRSSIRGRDFIACIGKELRLKIQREYRIEGTRFRVDGYNKRLNIAFEFYGDYWHGNPRGKHADESRYYATLARQDRIENRGITVIGVWERDWALHRKRVVARIKNRVDRIRR
jgi:DNA-directed RNA polymerase subunit RPC12/RpoP